MTELAIIGGTGLTQIEELDIIKSQPLETPYGSPSSELLTGRIFDREVLFLARHGNPHRIPPHKINYRANIWALKQLGIKSIIAVAAVGGITADMEPAHIAIPDQIIDYSYGREQSFFSDDLEHVTHIDFTNPYHHKLRKQLIAAAEQAKVKISPTGTYGCTQGPRLETSAEIIRMERDGCDLVGMTGMPEAALAKELEINYANLSVVANWAAGKSAGEITMDEIEYNVHLGMTNAIKVLKAFIAEY